jgi:competence protein ComEC
MFAWSPFPFIRYTLALIAGIFFYDKLGQGSDLAHLLWAFIAISFIVGFLHFWTENEWMRLAGGVSVLCTLAVVGAYISQLKNPLFQPNHYSHFENPDAFQGIIVSDFSERKDYFRYEIAVSSVLDSQKTTPAHGTLFLYVRKEAMDTVYQYGNQLSVLASYFPVNGPGNPEEFDYRSYLEKQGIFSHAFASSSDIQIIGHEPPNPILALAYKVRKRCMETIEAAIPQEREQAILMALLIGVKDRLDADIKAAYASAGAMHVLAVSGLHVGIVFIMINALFGFLKKRNSGKILFILLAMMLIWSYALVTGFSASVLRASVMFSVILIGQTLGKQSNIYNSLGVAAFILLLYEPYFIYSVGFQLSFAAVFGIVFLQPRLVRLWTPSGKVMNYLWQITCVSIAAQLATFPLTVFYFHQFPTYFLVSNIIVIPAAGVILGGGIAMIVLALVYLPIGQLLGWVVFGLIWIVNEAVSLLTLLPLPIVDWLYFDFYDTLLVYLIILAISLAIEYEAKFSVYLSMCFMLIWSVYSFFGLSANAKQKRMIVYEIKNHIAIDLVDGNEALLLLDRLDSAELEVIGFQVNPFRLANGLSPMQETYSLLDSSTLVSKFENGYLLSWNGKEIMILDQKEDLTVAKKMDVDYVYFNHEMKLPFDSLNTQNIIVGTMAKPYQIERMKAEVAAAGKATHSLAEDGFFEVKW